METNYKKTVESNYQYRCHYHNMKEKSKCIRKKIEIQENKERNTK